LATLPTNFNGTFNRTGRGFPDLAAQALLFTIISNGNKTEADSGTSASAPTIASIIALINDRLLSVGKPVLGLLNPWLYASATKEWFTDITEGSNPGLVCSALASAAFDAVEGWDPVSECDQVKSSWDEKLKPRISKQLVWVRRFSTSSLSLRWHEVLTFQRNAARQKRLPRQISSKLCDILTYHVNDYRSTAVKGKALNDLN
jgi:hypothetical protein